MGIFDWFTKRRDVRSPDGTARHERKPMFAPGLLAALEATRRPFVRVAFDTTSLQLLPTVSKLGGIPYMPVDAPRVSDGLMFLAQINFAEVPPLNDLPLPRTGVVQFWLEDNDVMGLYDSHGKERTDAGRVVYYASTDVAQAPARPSNTTSHSPIVFDDRNGRRMRFEQRTEIIAPGDYAFDAFLAQHGLPPEELDDLEPDSAGHKIGGYCAFTQWDPRTADDPMVSLLQLDSDGNVQWGDTGIAHWFIRESDLRAANFASTRFYWDCC